MAASNVRVSQMAHLKQKTISDNSCKAIIIDTILDSVSPLTHDDLADGIASIFHVLVSKERLAEIIQELFNDNILFCDVNCYIKINPIKQSDFIISRLKEASLQKTAALLWLDDIKSHSELDEVLAVNLQQALPLFLRSLFVRHGVSSYELLISAVEDLAFDVKQIATDVSMQFDEKYQNDIIRILPTIFQSISHCEVMEYLKHSVDKAVGYISEVISDENLAQITKSLKELTIYLDTNAIYRLLNLQGQMRYDSIKETLDFCRENGVKLKVSALTKKELSSRLNYDSKVLLKFPTKVNLLQYGYKYRTTDNYVSTYWGQAQATKVSALDFIEYYKNFDILLEAEQVEIESIEVDETSLIEHTKDLFGKMSLRDPSYEKSDYGLWHDAYNFAYVQKMQKADAKTAIDTGCLFLTTDQALITLQREDHDLKGHLPVVISPSQLLQFFGFSKPDCGYEETFVKFFASSSLGRSFEYNNDDIQEILSRIGHYNGISPEIAEKILARQITNSRYLSTAIDEEREDIIYNAISEELVKDIETAHAQVAKLESKNAELATDHESALQALEKNKKIFAAELQKLQADAIEANQQTKEDSEKIKRAEEEIEKANEYSRAQEKLYVDEKWTSWRRRHLICFWLAIPLFFVIIGGTIYFYVSSGDTGHWGILALLAVPLAMLSFGYKAYSAGSKTGIRKKFLQDYKEKLQQ